MLTARLYLRTPYIYREVGVVGVPPDVSTLYIPIVEEIDADLPMEVHVGFPLKSSELAYHFKYRDPVSDELVYVHEQEATQ